MAEEFRSTHNIDPVSIKEITTKKSSVDDAIYMIGFNRDHVSKREVHKIRYFSGIVVKWRNPTKNNKGPTQCSKCTMYGHGSSNCFRTAVCSACAGGHDVATCPLSKTLHAGPVVYKCFNCVKQNFSNVNHKADDPKCPSRAEYLKIRLRVTAASSKHPGRSRNMSEFQYIPEEFPEVAHPYIRPGTLKSHSHVDNTNNFRTYGRSDVNTTAGMFRPHSQTADNRYR